MHRFRIRFRDATALGRTLEHELARGAVLVKVEPPEGIEFRDRCVLELASPLASLVLEVEVVSVLSGIGVAVTFPVERLDEARALQGGSSAYADADAVEHELVLPEPEPSDEDVAPGAKRLTSADKIRLALHGTRDDRAAILRDPNRAFHAFVLKSAKVTQDEIVAWAKNPQMNAEFLRQIADRKDWLARTPVAQGLARNPKTPPEIALRALDYVGIDALRLMAKGAGVPAHLAAAARKKVMTKK